MWKGKSDSEKKRARKEGGSFFCLTLVSHSRALLTTHTHTQAHTHASSISSPQQREQEGSRHRNGRSGKVCVCCALRWLLPFSAVGGCCETAAFAPRPLSPPLQPRHRLIPPAPAGSPGGLCCNGPGGGEEEEEEGEEEKRFGRDQLANNQNNVEQC